MILYAIILIAIGIAADNLMIAGLTLSKTASISNRKWVIILLLLFIVQYQMLWLGNFVGAWAHYSTGNYLLGTGLLLSVAINICRELFQQKITHPVISYTPDNLLLLAFSTSMYVFIFSVAVQWLNIHDQRLNYWLVGAILIFLNTGVILGRLQLYKPLRFIRFTCTGMLLAGTLILILKTL
ncbi:hypothetical protein SAMN05421821_10664 [Mucilaginibacter lappiensis]|uniref:Mn2+ efflux pump MntP n=1 Tax=Mucilaginibacter lappiensis TaxID=354630 RepID=A0ABR6PKU3_9SPHI|nr:hypothetical protein [Mucilaginibacter lappiensis]MBB6110256.1 putative Mn2+ efflux pump MntP [Mucilaginibacter lappiensis]SIR28089.1 hypothetical protein SAMN05421821_10664 [Mucilaginibacter lappiensis]